MSTLKVKDVDKKSILAIAKTYAEDPYITFGAIANMYGLSAKFVSDLIWRGVAENIIPTTTADIIYNKVIHVSRDNVKQRIEHWDLAFEKRSETTAKYVKHLELLRQLEKILMSRIENYPSYVETHEKPLSEAELNERLEGVKKQITHCQNHI